MENSALGQGACMYLHGSPIIHSLYNHFPIPLHSTSYFSLSGREKKKNGRNNVSGQCSLTIFPKERKKKKHSALKNTKHYNTRINTGNGMKLDEDLMTFLLDEYISTIT